MLAIVLTESGAEPTVATIPVPQPGSGEVLVKMHSSPINPSDLAFLAGGYGIKKPFPVVPGFEGSGTVVAAGKGILPKIWLGKKVACAASPKLNGCWAEYMVTSAASCVPLSKKISMEQGSMMFVNPMTAIAFFDVYNTTPNPSKKLRGIINTAAASALGRMIIQLGKQKGIPVISVVRREEQVEMLKKAGLQSIPPYAAKEAPQGNKFYLLFGRTATLAHGQSLNNPILNEITQEQVLWIHPDRAKPLGISDGDEVEINGGGSYTGRMKAFVTPWIHQEAVFMLHGFGATVPLATRAKGMGVADQRLQKGKLYEFDPAGGGCAMTETIVEIKPAVLKGARK